MLAEPAQSLTDLALGLVAVTLAIQLRRSPATHRHWRAALWWFGIAALVGAVHHAVFVQWAAARPVSWAIVSVCVVVAVSYLLAATVAEVIGPSGARAFWLLGVSDCSPTSSLPRPGTPALRRSWRARASR